MQLVIFQTIFQVTFAIIIYLVIIRQRTKTITYVVGWLLIMPLTLVVPFWLIDYLKVDNLVVRLALATPTYIVFFRCIEAMYGTSPPVVETNIGTYCVYYTSIMHFDWDEKTQQRKSITLFELGQSVWKALQSGIMLSAITSFMISTSFRPFASSNVVTTDYHLHFNDLLAPSHLANAYIAIFLVQCTLSLGFALTALGDEARGLKRTKPFFNNPLLTSTSPSDFWSRKWNVMMHRVLKYGSFLPARKSFKFSVYSSMAITYVTSGLLHEYANMITFYHRQELRNPETGLCDTCYVYHPGKTLAFFAWNAVVTILEKPVTSILHHFNFPKLPLPILSTLVVMTSAHVSHWIYGDNVAANFFHHLSIGLWKLEKVP
jgi:Membrane bound O-acyl transferase family